MQVDPRDPRVEEAVARFRDPRHFVPAREFPAGLDGLDSPGFYAWRVDEEGSRLLADVLGCSIPGLLYVGHAGATRWPSGGTTKATLRSRIRGQHLRGRISASTFRLTVASLLADTLNLQVDQGGELLSTSNERLSEWIAEHLALAVYPIEDRDILEAIEKHVVQALDPPLNLDHVVQTEWRRRLSALCSGLRSASPQVR